MVQGFNCNKKWGRHDYHIQTEDWGADCPYFVTSIFKEGKLLKSVKVAYQDVFGEEEANFVQIRAVLKTQHNCVLDWIEESYHKSIEKPSP